MGMIVDKSRQIFLHCQFEFNPIAKNVNTNLWETLESNYPSYKAQFQIKFRLRTISSNKKREDLQ